MERNLVIKKLRNGEPLQLYRGGMFTTIQINPKAKRVCWERWISKDNKSWINWNLFLSLQDVIQIYNDYEKGEID